MGTLPPGGRGTGAPTDDEDGCGHDHFRGIHDYDDY